MQLLCPFCGSSHVQLHPVVHAAGTQHMHLNHSGVVDGRFMQGASHGTQYSALAQHCAPPAPPSPMPFLIAYGLGGMLSYQACMDHGGIQWKWVFSGALVVAIGWGLMKVWHHAANEYGLEKQRWQNTRFCHGCGQSHMLT